MAIVVASVAIARPSLV